MEGQGGLGTWRRYKLGQAQFTKWLKHTSDKVAARKQQQTETAVAEASFDSNPTSSKNKKKAKISLADLNGTASTPASVHWSQLETMASTIVENEIPEAPINILRDVVNLRRKSARFFARISENTKDDAIKAKNATHEHIIGVLDRVLARLEGLRAKVRGREKREGGNVAVGDLNNRFEHLKVEDGEDGGEEEEEPPEEHVNGAARKSKKTKGGKRKGRKPQKPARTSRSPVQQATNWVDTVQFNTVTTELDEDDPFDYYMLVYCFFEDFNVIRDYVRERWCDYYYDGSVHLNTLVVITNAACEFFTQMTAGLRSVLGPRRRDLADYGAMANMLFFEYGIDHINHDSYDELDKEEAEERMFSDEAEWLGITTFWDMCNILDHTPVGKVSTKPPSLVKQPGDLYGAVGVRDRHEFNNRVLMEYLQEAATMKALKKNGFEPTIIPAETEMLLNFERALEFRIFPASVIFSLQLYIDIRYIMEDKVGDAFAAMQKTGRWVDRTLEAHKEHATGPRASLLRDLNGWQKDNRHYLLEDITLVDKRHRYEVMHIDEPVPEWVLHKADPVWTSLLDFRSKLTTNAMGDAFASRVPLIEAAACIYFAARAAAAKSSSPLPPWRDIDKFASTHSSDSRFRLGLQQNPHSPFAILNNWSNIPSISSASSSSSVSSRFTKPPTARSQSTAIRSSLLKRYCHLEEKAHLRDSTTLDYAHELIMHRLRIDAKTYASAANAKRILAVHRELEEKDAANGHGGVGFMHRALDLDGPAAQSLLAPGNDELSPLEVLKILDDSVETLLDGVLSLDYFKLWDESVALVRAVSEAFSAEFRAKVADMGAEPDCLTAVPMLIAGELKAGAEEDRTGGEMLDVLVESVRAFLEGMAASS